MKESKKNHYFGIDLVEEKKIRKTIIKRESAKVDVF